MDALLTAITLWLAANCDLPATFDHPQIKQVPSIEMAALRYKGLFSTRQREVFVVQEYGNIHRKNARCGRRLR